MRKAAEETADARGLAGRVHNAAGETADASGLAAKRVTPPLSAGKVGRVAHGLGWPIAIDKQSKRSFRFAVDAERKLLFCNWFKLVFSNTFRLELSNRMENK
ncbi:hypothetical protein HMSSN036_88650 [Paenibacillus macerans]|nr:hypothetical protein HMSSN036_88650 [Paenibacillus macerans]